ncbi:RodZ domain-containing protein [Marinospirillum perlucidum]|uniref:RodZ domain-containing protein n=1 Tax=Marinospirillum perlucidum TaxID=1982602 RepID=UPI000DF3AA28|nr:RodZ domain-containing protein [Marinospirillum perlucidum]
MTETQQDEQPKAASENQGQATPACSRPGELLRKAREDQGLSQAEVAKQLNFLPFYVPSLENEDFTALHNKTFIKGYMRAYARFLKIDADEVLRCFAEHHPQLENQERIQPVEGIKPPKSGRSLVFKLFTLLIILALVAVIILWWQSRNLEPLPSLASPDVQVDTLDGQTISAPLDQPEEAQDEEAAAAEENANTAEGRVVEEVVEPISALQTDQEPTQLQALPQAESQSGEGDDQTAANDQPSPPPVEDFTGDPLVVTANQPGKLALTYSGDCWTEIRDSLGRVLHASLNRSGDAILLEGEPPFRLVFGQGRAVDVFYQGEEVDLSSRIRSNGYTSISVE